LIQRALLALALLALAGAATADPPAERALPPPGEGGWERTALPGVDRATVYLPLTVEGMRAVRAHSICSASALELALPDSEAESPAALSWRWKVEWAPVIENHRIRSGDDFALRVVARFAPPAGRGLLERARERIVAPSAPELHYVWSRRASRGERWPSPSRSEAFVISVGGGTLGVWETVEVDLRSDFERSFGRPAPALRAIGLVSDTDDSCQEAAAYIGDLRLLGPLPAEGSEGR
jgi:hypothetical protein